MTRKFVLPLLLLLVFCVGVPVGAQDEGDLQEIDFFLSFIPNIQFAPLYVGQEKGYFAEIGAELNVIYADEPDGVNLIAAGQIEYGIVGGEQVIQARANGRPIVYFYEWFQQFPVGIVVDAAREVTEVADLEGLKIGIPGPFGVSYSGLIAILAAEGLTEQDIQLESIGFNAPDVFCMGVIDGSVVYINNEPVQIQHRADRDECAGVKGIDVLPMSYVIDLLGNGLVTSEALFNENPDLTRGMAQAFDRGLRDTINNPAQAYLINESYVENLPLSDALRAALEAEAEATEAFLLTDPDRLAVAANREAIFARLAAEFDVNELIQFEILLRTIELWDADVLGWTDLESWEATQEVFLLMGFINEAIDLNAAYTNDLLTQTEETETAP